MAAAASGACVGGLNGCLGGLPATSVGDEGRADLPLTGELALEFAGEFRREFLAERVGEAGREFAGDA